MPHNSPYIHSPIPPVSGRKVFEPCNKAHVIVRAGNNGISNEAMSIYVYRHKLIYIYICVHV